MATESLSEELSRLVREYVRLKGSEREEAWNLLADFVLENQFDLILALRASENLSQTKTTWGFA